MRISPLQQQSLNKNGCNDFSHSRHVGRDQGASGDAARSRRRGTFGVVLLCHQRTLHGNGLAAHWQHRLCFFAGCPRHSATTPPRWRNVPGRGMRGACAVRITTASQTVRTSGCRRRPLTVVMDLLVEIVEAYIPGRVHWSLWNDVAGWARSNLPCR